MPLELKTTWQLRNMRDVGRALGLSLIRAFPLSDFLVQNASFFSRSEMERTRTRRLQAVRHGTGGRESHLDIYGNSTVGKLDGWYLAIVF